MIHDYEDVYERFHYTDINGLLGILGTRTLRLCSYKTMNDTMELRWSIHEMLKSLRQQVHGEQEINFLNEIESSIDTVPLYAYLTCFSSENDLLSQWRAYGDDGRGFAIGFDLAATCFDKAHPTITQYDTDPQAGYFDVSYNTYALKNLIPTYLSKVMEGCQKQSKPDRLLSAKVIATYLIIDAVKYKNPAFREEKETRIVNLTYRNHDGGFIGTTSDVMFKSSGYKLTSYFEYKFPKNVVTQIVLGPKNEVDRTELELFLTKNGYDDVTITRSAASYR